jgi:hypothetical protein
MEVGHSATFSIYVIHNMSFDQRNSPTFTLLYQTVKKWRIVTYRCNTGYRMGFDQLLTQISRLMLQKQLENVLKAAA